MKKLSSKHMQKRLVLLRVDLLLEQQLGFGAQTVTSLISPTLKQQTCTCLRTILIKIDYLHILYLELNIKLFFSLKCKQVD